MEESLIEFFALHKRLFLAIHILGVSAGMGGATITDILFFNFLRDFRISKKEAEVMHVLSNIIMTALVLLYISGIALFFSDPEHFAQSAPFLSKAFIVVVITVNGVLMHKLIAPHMVKFYTSREMHNMRPIAFAMGAISFTSWYSVFGIAMLKSYIPETATVSQMLSVYAVVLIGAIATSQFLHLHIHGRSK